MIEVEAGQLKEAVENTHNCEAQLAYVDPVSIEFEGERVWDGLVHVFDVRGHPTAKQAYAWSSPIEGSDKRRFFAVLHQGPVTGPVEAVRAAIVAEHRSSQ